MGEENDTSDIVLLQNRIQELQRERWFMLCRMRLLEKETARLAKRPEGDTLKCIPKSNLTPGRWYLGIGRGSNVAFWTGKEFCYFEEDMGEKSCNHWEDGPPFGCFQPFEEIDCRKYGKECHYIETE